MIFQYRYRIDIFFIKIFDINKKKLLIYRIENRRICVNF